MPAPATNGTNGSHIPEVCRAAVCLNSGPNYTLELREDFPVPKPGPGELLVRLNATGICLSDHHYMEGETALFTKVCSESRGSWVDGR